MVKQGHLVLASGILLGCHFGTWVICIENTSLPHALLVGSCAPIIIAVGSWILRKPISKGEFSRLHHHSQQVAAPLIYENVNILLVI